MAYDIQSIIICNNNIIITWQTFDNASGNVFESIPQFLSVFDDLPKKQHRKPLSGGCFNVSLSCWLVLRIVVQVYQQFFGCFSSWWYTQTSSCYMINDCRRHDMHGQHRSAQLGRRFGILDIITEIDNKQVKGDILSEQSILRSKSIKFNKPFANRAIATKKVDLLDDFFYDQLRTRTIE